MKQLIFISAILIFAFFYRFSLLNYNPASLFSDEVDIGYQVKSFLATGKDYYGNPYPLQFRSFSDVRTSLPIYATALVSRIPGVDLELAIRLTPAIFSFLSIIVIYFLTNELFKVFDLLKEHKSVSPGIWSALVLTIIPWHYTYSRTGFELSMLFFFFVFGLFLYLKYLSDKKIFYLILSLIIFALTPMIYSTAKLAVLMYPLILLFIPGTKKIFWNKKISLVFLILFVPLGVLFLSGGASQRFDEVSIFTDPTISTQTDFRRKADLGPDAPVGSTTGLVSRVAHNKVVFVGQNLIRNILNPLSVGYLFLAGDPNSRHAVQGWGMLEKSLIIPLFFGLYFLSRAKKNRFLIFISGLMLVGILPASLTRDGWHHSSRNFMLILPLVLLASYGITQLGKIHKLVPGVFVLILFFESFLFFHDYWYHYPFDSQRDFHAGLKEAVLFSAPFKDTPVIITRKYEPPLIFYLYYSDFPPARFQEMAKADTFYQDIDPELNLEGKRFGDTNVYFASVQDTTVKDLLRLKYGLYILMPDEAEKLQLKPGQEKVVVSRLPSGEILFYGIPN